MTRIVRSIEHVLAGRLAEEAPLIQVLIGPRQVGKTTAIRGVLAGRGVYESADSPVPMAAAFMEQWWARAMASPDRILAIDEVQKIPGWVEMLKRLWDERGAGNLKVVVSGSAALLIERGLRESLAGRYELIRAEHWGFAEAQESFGVGLGQFVEFGGYPGAARFLGETERWAEYVRDAIVEPAIGRDLLQLHPVQQPALLRQVFGVAVSLPAQIVSLQKIQGELQNAAGTLPTIAEYLRLLADAFVVTAVRKYNPHQHTTRASIPKLITHDNALLRAFERPVTGSVSPVRLGQYLENCVGARFIEAGWETWYWKDRDLEVDYVVRGPKGENWAVEVKTALVTPRDLASLRAFCARYPEFEPCLLRLTPGEAFPGVRELDPSEILSLHRA